MGAVIVTANALDSRASPDRPISRTIELTDRELQDVARLLTQLKKIISASNGFTTTSAHQDEHQLVAQAAVLIAARNRRLKYFNASMFGEPAWDMLLTLYSAETSGRRLTISRLIENAGAPATTALRWLDYLEDQLLVKRETHPTDARASFVRLTERAQEKLEMYLSETLAQTR